MSKADLDKVGEMTAAVRQMRVKNARLQEVNRQLVSGLMREQSNRRKTHNELEDTLGRVRTYVRVRPMLSTEIEAGYQQTIKARGNRVEVFRKSKAVKSMKVGRQASGCRMPPPQLALTNNAGLPCMLQFDVVFGGASPQHSVFTDVGKLLQSAVDGYNVCIMCFGAVRRVAA